MDGAVPVLDEVVATLRAAGRVDVPAVERAAGVTLGEKDGNAAFAAFGAAGVRSGGHTLAIDLRVPRPGGGATGGALLVLEVAGPCLDRAGVERRFGPLFFFSAPRGAAAAEQAYWSRAEPWGELRFGFAGNAPHCLGSVVFAASAAR